MSISTPRRAYADTPLGQVHYVEQGEGPAIVLMHQTPRSFDEFREVLPLLAASHRVLAIDMPGFGLSYEIPAPQSIEAIADGVLAFLDALSIETTDLLGHHTGGAVAVEVAARAPHRVRSLLLSSAPWADEAYRDAHAGGPGVDEADVAHDGSHLTTWWALRQPYYPAGRPDLLDRFVRDALAPGVTPAEGHMACGRYVMEDRIGQVVAPTLLIGASDDPFALPSVAKLAEHLVKAERVEQAIIPGGTIPLMETKSREVADAVESFLRS
ncbi:alpha/beta fold hydrolase [Aeromicrobium chenweiae]|uniref:Alpha/beta hydrolase n=1 Tax=Aeromicrobium chenweiae TaxID=2079793 RepID=A0A2S0WSG4_9ACTN|nr:alpha/beta fold hydrolase [Aeromicrobium chenweiae]AWB94231.1 alpha/beta hydrolase [Aeromicrobium chenweiae]TGN30437.1 alpha/beta fold hydrolase [Aeromicrobium chenweiae]